MNDVFTEDVRAAMHSGMRITFIYDVELARSTALWVDRTLAWRPSRHHRVRHPHPALHGNAPGGRPDGARRTLERKTRPAPG